MSETRHRLSLSELEETSEYQKLTQKQRLFVATYCQGGISTGVYDPVTATRTAYECKTMEVARIMSYSLMANIRIVSALNRHFNAEPIEEFLVLLDRAINNKKLTVAQFNALKLKGDIMGFTTRLPGTDKQATDTIPPAVAEASREARKAKRKTPERPPKVDPPTGYEDH